LVGLLSWVWVSVPFTNPIVAGSTLIRDAIQSPNFSIGDDGTGDVVTGWQIAKDGSATFYDVTVGGADYTIDSDGDAAFNDLDVAGTLTLGGTDITNFFDEAPSGVVAYGDNLLYNVTGALWLSNGVTLSGATVHNLAELSGGPLRANHIYGVKCIWNVSMSDTTTNVRQRLQYTLDGSKPNVTTSPTLPGSQINSPFVNVAAQTLPMVTETLFVSLTDVDTFRVCLAARIQVGAGTANAQFTATGGLQGFQFAVIDYGYAGDALNTSSLSQQEKFSGSPDADPVSTFVKTYNCTWSRAWNDGGNAVYATNGDLKQGYIAGTGAGGPLGNGVSWIGFPFSTIQSNLSGATVTKLEIYLYFNHWYNNNGGTAIFGTHSSTATSAPSYNGALDNTYRGELSGWSRNAGKWVNLSGIITPSEFKTGASTGIVLGPGPSNNAVYYGKANGFSQSNAPKLRITYTK
jgi:hypothetical protein